MFKKLKHFLGLSKGIFKTDKNGFILWNSFKEETTKQDIHQFKQGVYNHNYKVILKREKLNDFSFSNFLNLFKKISYPKIKTIIKGSE